jgi:hypothetical protein
MLIYWRVNDSSLVPGISSQRAVRGRACVAQKLGATGLSNGVRRVEAVLLRCEAPVDGFLSKF